MGARGPTPKNPRLRKRGNPTTLETRALPSVAEAATFEVPPMPERGGRKGWSKPVKDWWAAMWRSPMARMWLESDALAIMPHLLLLHQFAHDARTASDLLPVLSAIAKQEARLGVSPADRRRLQWEIPPDGDPEPEEEQRPALGDRRGPDPRKALSVARGGLDRTGTEP